MLDDDSPLDRLKAALRMDEPTLPGVVPPEPEQHRFPGMEREPPYQAAPSDEQRDGNAQFLREEDRTRPMPRPTLSMPGMDFYVGPVHPMQTGGFDRQAWGAARTALPEPGLPLSPQAVPDIAEVSPLGRLMGALTQPDAPTPDPDGPQSKQAIPAIEEQASQELRQGDPGTHSPQVDEAVRAQEPSEVLTEARDRLAELMERLDPGHAERQAAITPDERAQQIEDQLQAFQRGREADHSGRSF